MESARVTIRIPPALYAACKRQAVLAGVSIGEWLRGLAEASTGVPADVHEGLTGVSPRRRKQIACNAAKARWAGGLQTGPIPGNKEIL